jgi:RNA polymerase sigma-70 factor (sigma-E family)
VDDDEFRSFVAARLPGLQRAAYLLCGDVHQAEDLVSITIGRVLRQWRRIRGMDRPDAYVRKILVNAFIDERRRPWRRERPASDPPDRTEHHDRDVVEHLAVRELLAQLPPRARAVLVLRFLDDLSVEETAAALNLTPGTVKSHTARGLSRLRALLAADASEVTP